MCVGGNLFIVLLGNDEGTSQSIYVISCMLCSFVLQHFFLRLCIGRRVECFLYGIHH